MSYYVTTPIYYVNAEPHLGHAYSTLAADVLARHMRQRGEDVFFLTGTDEHGEPIEIAAEREGVTPQELADRNAAKFEALMPIIDATNDFFIRTSDPRHAEKVGRDHAAGLRQRLGQQGHLRRLVLPALRRLQNRARARSRPDLPDPRDPAGAGAARRTGSSASPPSRAGSKRSTKSVPTSSSRTSAATRRSRSSRAGSRTSRSRGRS